jgi:hypothetical protein
MPVPSAITDLTTVATTNSPAGSELPSTADDYFRAHASFIAQMRAVIGGAVDAAIPSSALGVGQTWQDFTGSRALSTTYTNATGRPIGISVSSIYTPTPNFNLTVSGLSGIGLSGLSDGRANIFCVIPAGATYSIAGTAIQNWRELR